MKDDTAMKIYYMSGNYRQGCVVIERKLTKCENTASQSHKPAKTLGIITAVWILARYKDIVIFCGYSKIHREPRRLGTLKLDCSIYVLIKLGAVSLNWENMCLPRETYALRGLLLREGVAFRKLSFREGFVYAFRELSLREGFALHST